MWIILGFGIVMYMVTRSVMRGFSSSEYHEKNIPHDNESKNTPHDEMQLNYVKNAVFSSVSLMNKYEYWIFRDIEELIKKHNKGYVEYRLMAQVSLGEILKSKNKNAYRSINSKRVDMLIINCYGKPICAIEYQGSGHYQGNYKIRDEIKRTALEKAGIKLLEIKQNEEITSYIDNINTILSNTYET